MIAAVTLLLLLLVPGFVLGYALRLSHGSAPIAIDPSRAGQHERLRHRRSRTVSLALRVAALLLALPVWFALSLGVMALAASLADVLRLGFFGAVAFSVGAPIVALALDRRRTNRERFASQAPEAEGEQPLSPAVESAREQIPLLAAGGFAGGLMALAWWTGPWLSHTADSFYHLAAIRALLLDGEALPHRVFYPGPVAGPDPTSGAWHYVIGLAAWIAHVDPTAVWWAAGGLVAALAALSLFRLALAVSRCAGTALLTIMLFYLLGQRLDLRTASYPTTVGLALAWLTLSWGVEWLREHPNRRSLAAGLLVATAIPAIHLAAYQFLAVTVGALVSLWLAAQLLGRRSVEWRAVGPTLALVASGAPIAAYRTFVWFGGSGAADSVFNLGGAVAVPYLTPRELGGGLVIAEPGFWFASTFGVASIATVLVLLRLGGLWRGDPGAALVVATVALIPALAFNPLVAPWTIERLSYPIAKLATLLPFGLYLSLGWGLATIAASWRLPEPAGYSRPEEELASATLSLVGSAAVIPLVAQLITAGPTLVYAGTSDHNAAASRAASLSVVWRDRLDAIGKLPPDSVILSDPTTSYYLGGLARVRVVVTPPTHTPSTIEHADGARRRADAFEILAAGRQPDTAGALLAGSAFESVTHVFLDFKTTPAAATKLDAMPTLQRVAEGPGWRLFRVDRLALAAEAPAPAEPIAGRAGDALPLRAAGIWPKEVRSGEGLFVHLVWASSGEQPSAATSAQVELNGPGGRHRWPRAISPGGDHIHAFAVPPSLSIGRYDVSLRLPDGDSLPIGQVTIGMRFEAEWLRGLVPDRDYDYQRVRGWSSYSMGQYSGGKAAITRELGAHIRTVVPPVGVDRVQARVLVHDYGNGAVNALRLRIGGVERLVQWSGNTDGLRWVTVELALPDQARLAGEAGSTLSIEAVQGNAGYLILDAVELWPVAN
ncbi:MAG: hypothetical protein HY329_07820 [Chloroflexi bacterium]|nr:hypothetical protein [Chloroflexota bacterium]